MQLRSMQRSCYFAGLVRRTPAILATLTVLVVVSLGAFACKGLRTVPFREGPREYVAADYEPILERWTRSEKLYSFQGLDDVLSVTSTFESWDFRWAYVIRYAEDYRLTIDQRRELLTNTLNDARQHHQFYVTLAGAKHADSDLTKESPAWVVRLVDDRGHVTAPEELVRIRKPGVLEHTYFPYTNVWRQAFRVRFPARTAAGPAIADDASLVALRFSGPLGNLELRWVRSK